MSSENPRHKVTERLDVTFTDKMYEKAETQSTYMTDGLNWTFEKKEQNRVLVAQRRWLVNNI